MKKQDLIKEMVIVADYFDKQGMDKEADVIDSIIQKVAQAPQAQQQAQPKVYSQNPKVNAAVQSYIKNNPQATPQQIQATAKKYEQMVGGGSQAAQPSKMQVVKDVAQQAVQKKNPFQAQPGKGTGAAIG